jgi:catechol 2,3-dioxygenase-like lactoylglutathione lyase family enzyme
MRLQPIVYTQAMDRAVEWYATVLGDMPEYRSDVWTSFRTGSGHLALHRTDELPEGSRVELSLITEIPLEQGEERLASGGIEIARGIQEETFGRSLVLEDPEGLTIQVNEHHGDVG